MNQIKELYPCFFGKWREDLSFNSLKRKEDDRYVAHSASVTLGVRGAYHRTNAPSNSYSVQTVLQF
jgi:hypothetical protein